MKTEFQAGLFRFVPEVGLYNSRHGVYWTVYIDHVYYGKTFFLTENSTRARVTDWGKYMAQNSTEYESFADWEMS